MVWLEGMDDVETLLCVKRFGTEPEHGAADACVLKVTFCIKCCGSELCDAEANT